ncbi:chemotaxis protein CheX [Agilicoccus flavus]|uniref:chemotaxis protein CheX n=1 Tax=Agilicoccus flavus TaxID=2775968 RepID=UPI001CF6094F|nr:chemotaxis protein CheX [Agilicoccus flavus]
MHLSSDDVAQIVEEVWGSMLAVDIAPADIEVDKGDPSVAGSVGVTGATDCLISLEISESGARNVAAAMFGLDEADVSDDDIADTIGELTNMVGGNIKSLLPEPSTLSLPVVASGRGPTLRVVGGTSLLQQGFLSAGHPMFVNVWNRASTS